MPAKKQVDTINSMMAKRGNYGKTLEQIKRGGYCPFCEKNLMKHHNNPILMRGAYWLVTKNAWPYEGSQHHFLLIPRAHIERIEDATSSMWGEFHKHLQSLSKRYRYKGGTLVLRSGDTARTGASITHLHAHFVVGGKRTPKAKEIRPIIGFGT